MLPETSSSTPVWNAGLYDARHTFVFELGRDLVGLLHPQPGERILDLGCGTGHLTRAIAETGADVLGLDQSLEMVEQARAHYPALAFEQGDARDFGCAVPFDAVFSNAVLHWILEPERVVQSVARALRPGGRFVAELGGKGNIAAIATALYTVLQEAGYPLPATCWYFPSLGEYASLLEAQGFRVCAVWHFDRPTALEGEEGLRNWLKMFTPEILQTIPDSVRPDLLTRIEAVLRPRLYRAGVWYADYVRLRFVAIREP
ncbi:class I SAM-dependent methyltransferase [Anthocerotibacter panamensis]|uniref:class I SAM-dependent methyltransferase n=1 Tax=Anthocerotibacter panamensis TaxID=2857077 RepID=UPI001C40652F|nr:methyltransferase domain-containing protein [Anthocerotibacter panamensis]